jgi:hypothetical protein
MSIQQQVDFLIERVERLERILVAAGICTEWDMTHNPEPQAVDVPDRAFIDDQGRRWEWCGGQPGTWAWRMTSHE